MPESTPILRCFINAISTLILALFTPSIAVLGLFKEEITAVSIPQRKGEPKIVEIDEFPKAGQFDDD